MAAELRRGKPLDTEERFRRGVQELHREAKVRKINTWDLSASKSFAKKVGVDEDESPLLPDGVKGTISKFLEREPLNNAVALAGLRKKHVEPIILDELKKKWKGLLSDIEAHFLK